MYFDNVGLRTVNVEGGPYAPIFDPSLGEGRDWHVNDHCIVHDGERWHMFGICFPSRSVRNFVSSFVHATSESLTHFPWDKEPWALTKDRDYGETRLWAPHVIEHDGLFFKEVFRILRQGGTVVITSPHDERGLWLNDVKERIGLTMEQYDHYRRGYSGDNLRRLLSAAGATR